ncbi:MAG: hypothetical protein R3F59_07945 [Myxococcota bacterium]
MQPAADFSTRSVRGLDTEGLVVLASSTGSELSQESDALGSSAFTHHLVAGLHLQRADREGDGTVTLDEACACAYDRAVTLQRLTALQAAAPTLELDVRRRGGLVLTPPRAPPRGCGCRPRSTPTWCWPRPTRAWSSRGARRAAVARGGARAYVALVRPSRGAPSLSARRGRGRHAVRGGALLAGARDGARDQLAGASQPSNDTEVGASATAGRGGPRPSLAAASLVGPVGGHLAVVGTLGTLALPAEAAPPPG